MTLLEAFILCLLVIVTIEIVSKLLYLAGIAFVIWLFIKIFDKIFG